MANKSQLERLKPTTGDEREERFTHVNRGALFTLENSFPEFMCCETPFQFSATQAALRWRRRRRLRQRQEAEPDPAFRVE